jgi:hypothetical protein
MPGRKEIQHTDSGMATRQGNTMSGRAEPITAIRKRSEKAPVVPKIVDG